MSPAEQLPQRLFPVAIWARTPAAQVDWRRDYGSLDYEVVELPDNVGQPPAPRE